jgi:uncharacterized membrane protein
MTQIAFALVVATAAIHAFWNAPLKQGSEGDTAPILVPAGHVAVGLASVAALGPPSAASLPYLAVSAVLQAIAWLAVSEGYRHGEFGAVYPLARATGPVGIALLAALVVPEWPSPGVAIGIAGVVAGILVRQFSGPVAVPRRVLAGSLIFGAKLTPRRIAGALCIAGAAAVIGLAR